MPTSSSSSSVHLTPYSRRRSARVSAAAAAAACQGGEQPGKAAATESSRASGVSSSMGPQQDPSKDVPNGPAAPKKEKVVVRYRECRKNHAASIGGYAVDGCREFMAGGEEGTSAALKCAACGCHRSFHKREVESDVPCDCSSDSTSSRR